MVGEGLHQRADGRLRQEIGRQGFAPAGVWSAKVCKTIRTHNGTSQHTRPPRWHGAQLKLSHRISRTKCTTITTNMQTRHKCQCHRDDPWSARGCKGERMVGKGLLRRAVGRRRFASAGGWSARVCEGGSSVGKGLHWRAFPSITTRDTCQYQFSATTQSHTYIH